MEKWYLLLFLLCPLMHLLMMRGHNHESHSNCEKKGTANAPNGQVNYEKIKH